MKRFYRQFALSLSLMLITGPVGAQTFVTDDGVMAMQGFGSAVAIGDNEVIVAEARNLFRSGIVYVFRRNDAGEWQEQAQLISPEPILNDRFGKSIAVSGNTMLVGASPGAEGSPGVVYLFSRNASGNWGEAGQLRPSDGAEGDGFGAALIIDGDYALVGAPNHDSTGAVYIFHREADGWLQVGKLTDGDAVAGDGFGSAMGLSGDHLLIGMPARNGGTGDVTHFHRIDGEWSGQGLLPRRSSERDTRFGSTIVVSGDRAFVGMPRANNRLGAVATYSVSDGDWQQGNDLAPYEGGRRAEFGSALAMTDDGLWVGTPGSRALYDFRGTETGFSEVIKISPDDQPDSRSFGGALAVKGDLAVVGIANNHSGGNALVYEREGRHWMASTFLTSTIEEGLPAITGERINCDIEGHIATWDCHDVDLVSFMPVGDMGGGRGVWLNDIWGWTDPETGHEIVISGRIDATIFIDISDPSHPRYLGELPKTEGSRTSVWRDIKVYKNHAYIVSDGAGEHGMQVVDLNQLREIGDEPVTIEEVFHYDGIHSAHNIVINEESGFAYIVGASGGGSTCGGGLHMLDIREPAAPVFVGCFSDTETGRRGTGYSHDAQCVMYTGPDEDYRGREICIGSNETAISFSDVSDKENPIAISNVTYPNVGYAHQGWLSEDQMYFFSNDEGDEGAGTVDGTRTLVWDVADLDDPILLTEYIAETTDTDHNLYVRGNLMYQSNYGAGLRILDVSDPENLVEVGYFDMQPEGAPCCSTWSNYPFFESGVIAVNGGNAGIFLLRKRENLVP